MQVKISQAVAIITKYIKARLVPMLVGSPGMGKSAIVHQIAASFNLAVIDLRVSQCDPTDANGFPNIHGKKAGYLPMDTFPIEGDPLPINPVTQQPYDGWLLFLDEFSSGTVAVQAAFYKIILDRMVGMHKLHKNVAIVCAGNLETDNAIVNPMSTAMQSRLVHLELVIDVPEWTDWASANDIDHRICDYIKFKPGNLYTFDPDHTDKTYACSRTWEFANRVLNVTDDEDTDRLPMLAGTVGEGVAREFVTFCKIYKDLPTMAQIIADPLNTKVPSEPSILFALTGSLSHNANKDNLTKLMQFIELLPVEFQVICLREMFRKQKSLVSHTAVQKWIATSAANLF